MDAERLLGQLLSRGLSGGRVHLPNSGGKGAIAMGLVGAAIAAYEHFNVQKAPSPPPPAGSAPPPPIAASVAPPPPPPPPSAKAPATPAGHPALLLVRAMIAAACADGELDEAERARIMEQVSYSGMDDESRQFLERELAAPWPITALAGVSTDAGVREQIYTVSVSAIRLDTERERQYLRDLAQALSLPAATIDAIHQQLGV